MTRRVGCWPPPSPSTRCRAARRKRWRGGGSWKREPFVRLGPDACDVTRRRLLVVIAGSERIVPLAIGDRQDTIARPLQVLDGDVLEQFAVEPAVGEAGEAVLRREEKRLALEPLEIAPPRIDSTGFAERG